MPITPEEIQKQMFSEARRGYDPGEVDAFLERLATEVDAMLQKIYDLKNRLTATEAQLADAQSQLASASELAPVQQPAVVPAAQPAGISASERQISAALIAAQQTADAKAREVIRQALQEKQTELKEIDRLKASREDFKAEYLKLLQHFMDDAQNSFPPELMASSTPVGSISSAAATPMPAVSAPEPEPVAVADPFAPLDNFGVDDLD